MQSEEVDILTESKFPSSPPNKLLWGDPENSFVARKLKCFYFNICIMCQKLFEFIFFLSNTFPFGNFGSKKREEIVP